MALEPAAITAKDLVGADVSRGTRQTAPGPAASAPVTAVGAHLSPGTQHKERALRSEGASGFWV